MPTRDDLGFEDESYDESYDDVIRRYYVIVVRPKYGILK